MSPTLQMAKIEIFLQKDLYQTNKVLSNTEEELRKCQYTLKQRDFIISEQKKAGN